ncbi:MAG: class I SAM-dependent methyltransferase [Patescibacteria group bacterium]
MNKKAHYKKQLSYFEKEFSGISQYKLAAWQKSYIQRIKEYLLDNDFKNKTLLDIGAGSGYVAVELAKYGINVIACDMSEQAIENLKKYKSQLSLSNLKFLVCKAEDIPLADNSVDYIVANALLEHIPNEKKAIYKWRKVLRKEGKMLITVPLSLKYVWPFLWLINILYDKRLGHLRRYDLNSLKEKFRLKVLKVFYTGHLLKVFGVIFSESIGIHRFDEFLEKQDRKKQDIQYGANNISVIFQNDK